MGPENPLPISPEFDSAEQYVDSLLDFIGSSELLHTLCGGVHVLDFFTRQPDLYSLVIPPGWRSFFKAHDIMDLLDLFMREDISILAESNLERWRNGPVPPRSLLEYLIQIRKHCLRRDHTPIPKPSGPKTSNSKPQSHTLARQVAVGMNVKKIHEVDNFCRYLDQLTTSIAASSKRDITHLVDFGAGQNYLGRALASEPYNRHIVALESKVHNIEGARNWDVLAKLAPKEVVLRNKKEWRKQREGLGEQEGQMKEAVGVDEKGERGFYAQPPSEEKEPTKQATLKISNEGVGSIQYVEHYIKDGDLSRVVEQIVDQDAIRSTLLTEPTIPTTTSNNNNNSPDTTFTPTALPLTQAPKPQQPSLLVISLHSCGNLVHHGLRSLLLNPAVSAVALVGCCYNLITERLPPAPNHPSSLRSNHPRLVQTSAAQDPHGFPMSDRLCAFKSTGSETQGLRLNITARMLAVQAPQNWGKKDSEGFFQRHFFRALLQKIFLDRGIVSAPKQADVEGNEGSPLGWSGPKGTTPIILGSLRKAAYTSFLAYVRAALEKLINDPIRGEQFKRMANDITDEEIIGYEQEYKEKEKELAVLWSLMAFSAGVIEAAIVVDRWLFLGEQEEIDKAWVEPVFEFRHSPRNLVVVGIKK